MKSLETSVNRSRDFPTGSSRGQSVDTLIAAQRTCCGQRVKQSILVQSKGQVLKWRVKNFDQKAQQ